MADAATALNGMCAAGEMAQLGTLINSIINLLNELRTDMIAAADSYNAVLAKLDADAGVTDTNYMSGYGQAGVTTAWPADPTYAAVSTI